MVKFTSGRQQARSQAILAARGGAAGKGDARALLIAKKRGAITDARDKLVQMARTGGDARNKIQKIRNLKEGKVSQLKRFCRPGVSSSNASF